jgi:hypothetical protein
MMSATAIESIWLDYGKAAASSVLIRNISGIAVAGSYLWTVSDEGRSIECLKPQGRGYKLVRQVPLDDHFPGLPGRETNDEAVSTSVRPLNGAF